MKNLGEQYEQISAEKDKITHRMTELANNDIVKEYLSLCGKYDQLAKQQKQLYRRLKMNEYSSCDHIWVKTLHKYDSSEGRYYNYCGCIKCGLDRSVLANPHQTLNFLPFEQQIMYIFMMNHFMNPGINTNVSCDLELAKAIYSKIKEVHPNIDDGTATKYFEIALDNIRNTRVNDDRKISRAKRLSLNPNFNRWN